MNISTTFSLYTPINPLAFVLYKHTSEPYKNLALPEVTHVLIISHLYMFLDTSQFSHTVHMFLFFSCDFSLHMIHLFSHSGLSCTISRGITPTTHHEFLHAKNI